MKPRNLNPEDGPSTAPTVLLTDTNRWPSPARLATGLAKAGFNVAALCVTPGHPLLKTRAVQQIFPYSGRNPLKSLRTAIDAVQPAIIIPCDDRGVQHLHQLHAEAREQGPAGRNLVALLERSLGPFESYRIVSGRYDLLRIAEQGGIRVPPTTAINSVGEFNSWKGQAFPWVLKVDGTWGGRGVRIAHTAEEAGRFFLELTQPRRVAEVVKQLIMSRDRSWLWPGRDRSRPSAIVQSHISGRPANCAVVCWQGKVLAGIAVEVVSSNGEKGPATIVRVVEGKAMMNAAERLAGRLRLSGFFGLDFMIEDGSDLAYLIEMNPRCTPLCHLQLGNGRDMVSALWAQVSGRPSKGIPPVTGKEMIAYFPQALSCEKENLRSSFLDRPDEDPGLIKELLHPWSERSVLGRMVDAVRQLRAKDESPKDHVFKAAISTASASDQVINLSAANSSHR